MNFAGFGGLASMAARAALSTTVLDLFENSKEFVVRGAELL